MTNHIAVKKTLKHLTKRNRRTKKNRRSVAAVAHQIQEDQQHELVVSPVEHTEQLSCWYPPKTLKDKDEKSVHLGTSIFPCNSAEMGTSAEVTSVHLASSVFPCNSAEQSEVEVFEGPKNKPFNPIWQGLVSNKAKSSEVIRVRPVPAKRYSVSAETTVCPPVADKTLGVLTKLSMAIQRNKFILDQILRNKDILARRDEISDSELVSYMASAESTSEEVNSKLRGLFSETEECNSKLRGLFSDITTQSNTSFDPRWLYKSCKCTTSATDATDLGSEFSLPSVPSDFLPVSSLASVTHVREAGTQTSEWRRLFSLFPSNENVGNQNYRMTAVEANSTYDFLKRISGANSVTEYVMDLEAVVEDYIDLCKKIYFPSLD